MKVILDGKDMNSREMTHTYLKRKLKLSGYYGANLDALWDILSTYSQPIVIELENEEKLIESLGDYGKSIIQVFEDAEEENGNIKFRLVNKNNLTWDNIVICFWGRTIEAGLILI